MCTVVFLPNNGQYCFASLRDESPFREPALVPEIYSKNGINYVAPLDAKAGGTWIGVNELGSVIILLNGGFDNHARQANYRKSRGLIVKELLATKAPVSDWLQMDLNNIEPFTLVVFSDNNLYQLVWDGLQKHRIRLDVNSHYIWSSATLYDTAAKATRTQFFEQWLSLNPVISSQSILSFFQSVNDTTNGFLINRSATMRTLSYTFLKVNNGAATMFNYHDFMSQSYTEQALAVKHNTPQMVQLT